MLEKTTLLDRFQDVVDAFSREEYSGTVHSLETPDEYLCSFYYIELKAPCSQDPCVQFAVLWRLLELNHSREQYDGLSGDALQEALRRSFQNVLDHWEARPLNTEDCERAVNLMQQCQSSFPQGSQQESWEHHQPVGYYRDDVHQEGGFPQQLMERIAATPSGDVLADEWNDLLCLLENNGMYSLFYWGTGA